MRYITFILGALLGYLTIATAAPASLKHDEVKFFFTNNCPFDVYVRQAVAEHPGSRPWETCRNFGETHEGVLPANGGTFLGQFEIFKDSCGHSVKVARKPGGPVYQFEYNWALENNRMWYNLSHEDGNPFTDVVRQLSAHNNCPKLRCEAGNHGSACDYELQTDCGTLGAMAGYLCGGSKGLSKEVIEELEKKAKEFKDLPKVEV